MTISSSPARVAYAGNGVTTAFSWPYPVFDDDDLIVIEVVTATGVGTIKTKTTHYTVSIAAGYANATVTMLTAPATGKTLVIVRKSAALQSKDFSAATVVDLDEIEENDDRVVVMLQDLQAQIDRALKTSVWSATNGLTVPEPEAGKYLAWNDDEDDLENRTMPGWVTGAGVPSDADDGSDGDMYLDTGTGDVYGPKTAGAWGAVAANIRGDDGPAGSSGVGVAWQGAWGLATVYEANEGVSNDGTSYICTAPHTSSADDEPGVGINWTEYWDVLAAKGDTGATGATGDTGPAGADGADGADGAAGAAGADGATPSIRQTYSTTTADADPGSGIFRLNNTTIASATAAYLDNNEIGGSAISAWLDTFDDSDSTVKGHLVIMGVTTLTHFAIFEVSGSVVDGTGYRKLTLTHVASNGTAGAWTNGNVFAITFYRAGDKGDTGAAGAGTGDVVGPGSAVDGHFAIFDGATGTLLKDTLAAPGALATKDTVGSTEIDNDAVTYAKMQDVSATSRFLGRITAGAGVVEELSGANAATIIGCYMPGGTDVALADGGTGASLADPAADRIMFWDDSAGAVAWLEAATANGLTITTTSIAVDINGLAADASPDSATDYVMTWDASASALKKVLLSALGGGTAASQAEMETATDTAKFVTPGRQHFHPGHPKFWLKATVVGNVPTLQTSYNVTSITDTATGRLTCTIATDFSGAHWCCQVTVESDDTGGGSPVYRVVGVVGEGTQAAGTVVAECRNINDGTTGGLGDPTAWHVMGLGDHA